LQREKEQIDKLRKSRTTKKSEGVDIDFSLVESTEMTRIDPFEQKEILAFKLSSIKETENYLREQKLRLDEEKITYMSELKRQKDQKNAKQTMGIILSDRYLILSLLGKGGYSEVYKAYDLDECKEVACKIH
jgi:tousled-like kinase